MSTRRKPALRSASTFCWTDARYCLLDLLIAVLLLVAKGGLGYGQNVDLFADAPRVAIVMAERIQVRSGPGNDFYPTSQLRRGDKVEVYGKQGEWFAIKPPPGEFSWVRFADIKIGSDGLAEVIADNVPCWVGSLVTGDRGYSQVKLRKGELVEVLGISKTEDGQLFARIAPPSGEFRWIQASEVVQLDTFLKTLAASGTLRGQSFESSESVVGVRPEKASPESLPAANLEPAALLARLNVELSRQLMRAPFEWELEPLLKEAITLRDSTTGKLHEETVRLVERIQQARQLHERAVALMAIYDDGKTTVVARQSGAASTSGAESGADEVGLSPTANQRVGCPDVGLLVRVLPRRAGGPRYALLNERGELVTYLTAIPDVNLDQYLGRWVQVQGVYSVIAEKKKPHITVSNVRLVSREQLSRSSLPRR